MGVTAYPWASALQVEANKFWFYGISFSILLCLYQISYSPTPKPPQPVKQDDKKPGQDGAVVPTAVRSSLLPQLTVDCLDILAPGAALGWIPASPLVVGLAYTVSSAIAARPIWQRVQRARLASGR